MSSCKTPGAIFHTQISPNEVACSIAMPFALELSEVGAERLDDALHDALETALAQYWQGTP